MSDNDENRIRLYSYDKVWKTEKKFHSIFNVKLPVPIGMDEMGYFFLVVAIMFFPLFKFLPTIIRYLAIPYLLTKFLTKKKLDGKNPIKFFIGFLSYIFYEKNIYIEHFYSNFIKKEEKIKLSWECSQGYASYAVGDEIEAYETEKNDNFKTHLMAKVKPRKTKIVKDQAETVKKKKKVIIPAGEEKKEKNDTKELKVKNVAKEIKDKKVIEKTVVCKKVAVCSLEERSDINQDKFIEEFITFNIDAGRKVCMENMGGSSNCDLEVYNAGIIGSNDILNLADIKILLCSFEQQYLILLANFIKSEKKNVKKWFFVFIDVPQDKIKEIGYMMEDYKCYCLPVSPVDKKEIEKIYTQIIK